MHPYYTQCVNLLTEHWEKDPRALAFAMNGSGGRGGDDEWSDLDVILAVSDDAYAAICAEMKELMGRVCGDIYLWLPEGETDKSVNYAFIIEHDGEQFLFDHSVLCESLIKETGNMEAGVVFFDKTGSLTGANRRFKDYKPDLDASSLSGIIDRYLVYTYLNGKYYRRKDTAKLLYIQNTLQGLHARMLAALYPDCFFTGWWCQDIFLLSPEHQKIILMYAAPPDCELIGLLVLRELDYFGRDAREACGFLKVSYPDVQVKFVLRQLTDAGLPGADA